MRTAMSRFYFSEWSLKHLPIAASLPRSGEIRKLCFSSFFSNTLLVYGIKKRGQKFRPHCEDFILAFPFGTNHIRFTAYIEHFIR